MKGIACPMPGSLEPLVEHATKMGIPNPVFETTRVYLAYNEARIANGLDVDVPSIAEADTILRNWFKMNKTFKDVKPGVSELFESNPELANAVYEALGFEKYNVFRGFGGIRTKSKGLDTLGKFYTTSKLVAGLYSKQIEVKDKYGSYQTPDENFIENKDIYIKNSYKISADKWDSFSFVKDIIGKDYTNKYNDWAEFPDSVANEIKNKLISLGYDSIIIEADEKRSFRERFDENTGKYVKYPIQSDYHGEQIIIFNEEQQKQQAQQLYSQYLDSIFPNSKVKEIVYHVNKTGKVSPTNDRSFYSTSEGTWLSELEEFKGNRIPILLNINNPTIVDSYYEFTDKAKQFRESGLGDEYVTPDEMKQEGTDAVIGRDSGQSPEENTYVTYKADQVHQLGTKEDIEGFKEFVGKSQSSETQQTVNDFMSSGVFSEYEVLARPITLSAPTQASLKTSARVATLLDHLSSNIGIPYVFITPEIARELTKGLNEWTGEPAFNLGNRIYIVADNITAETAFHEFAHPFIRAIRVSNPELYSKLSATLLKTNIGKRLYAQAQKKYGNIDDPIILEEAIVMALTESAVNREDSAFNSFIKDLLYAIKQLLRSIFGKDQKVSIEKLSADTTLEQLADMLVLDRFNLDLNAISREDVVAYMTQTNDLVQELLALDPSELQQSTNEIFNAISEDLRKIEKKKEYSRIKEVLKDAYSRSDLEEIRANLASYQTVNPYLSSEINKLKDDAEFAQKHAEAFLQSLERMKNMSIKMATALDKMVKQPATKDTVATVFYFNNVLTNWETFIERFQQILSEATRNNELNEDNQIYELTGAIMAQIASARQASDKLYTEGVSKVILETVAPMKERIDAKFKAIMDDIEKRGLSDKVKQIRLKDYYGLSGEDLNAFLSLKAKVESGQKLQKAEAQNYEILKLMSYKNGAYITDEKIKYLMSGSLGDAHAANSFLEGFIYNQDLIVSNFALWVKNRMTDVYTQAMTTSNEFVKEIKPLLDRAGYNQANPSAFFRTITFLDKRGNLTEKGVEEYNVHSFINPHKDYRKALLELDHEIQEADKKALDTGNTIEAMKLRVKRDEFLRNYFHNPYTAEYYERYKVFRKLGENDEIGIEAEALRKNAIDAIRLRSTMLGKPGSTSDENKITLEELDVLYREYRYLFSNYDENGNLKSARDIEIAQRLREYREASRDIFEEELIPNLFEDVIKAEEDALVAKGLVRNSPKFMERRAAIIDKLTRVKVKQIYYDKLNALYAEAAEIENKIKSNQKRNKTITDLQKTLNDLMGPYKDEDLQVQGNAIDEKKIAEIKKVQIELIALRKLGRKSDTLTKNEQLDYSKLLYLNGQRKLTQAEQERFDEYKDRIDSGKTARADQERLKEIYDEISSMSETKPTSYYLDTMETKVSLVDPEITQRFFDKYGKIDQEFSLGDLYTTSEFYTEVVEEDPQFKEWYDKNHIIEKVFDETSGDVTYKITRLKPWSVTKPNNPFYYETHSFINSNGEKEVLAGIPLSRFYKKVVKDKYISKKVTMSEALEMGDPTLATHDNKGNPLPKMDAPDNRFINEKFLEIKNDKVKYDALIALMKWHLKFQEGKEDTSKLYLDVPRYLATNYEIARNPGENPISRWWKNVRKFFKPSEDLGRYEEGFNYQEDVMLMPGELFDDSSAGVPITGLSRYKEDEVSLDVIGGMLRYNLSAAKQEALIDMLPTARALQAVVHNPNNYASIQKNLTGFQQKNRSITKMYNEVIKWKQPYQQASVRQKAIDNFIEREFEGKVNKGAIGTDSESIAIQNIAQKIMGASAFGYFALDIPSALKNDFSLRIQSSIEAAAGRFFNHASYAKGSMWANSATWEVSLNIYSGKTKGHNEQLLMLFDAFQGRFESKYDEMMSRSFAKDAIGNLRWMTSFRKWTELNSTLAIFGAMMYHEKNITRVVDGKETKINYMDAWETVDGQIRLKEGVDPEWGPQGAKFKQFKNRIQGVVNNLAGSFAKFDYAEADRYFAYRFAIAFKRWFTRMFLNRFQYRGKIKNAQYRYDNAVGDQAMGYWIEGLRGVFRSIKAGGDYYKGLSDTEKAAMIRILADVAYTVLAMMAISLLFDFDPDDEDKFKKLREKSGPLPFLGVSEDETDFKFKGWMSNHALYMTMQLKQEQTQWLPIPGIGAEAYIDMLKMDSVAMHNTWDNYKKIMSGLYLHTSNALFGTDDSKAYFDQREGPYDWMQEDGSKVMTYLARAYGITGKSLDPAMAVTNFVKAQNWR